MLSPLGPSRIFLPIMQLTIYLIFILVPVLETIGLGFTATHLFKFSVQIFLDINSWDPAHLPVHHQAYFIVHIQIPTTLTLLILALYFFLLLTTGVQPTFPSFTYFTPISPFHCHRKYPLMITATTPADTVMLSKPLISTQYKVVAHSLWCS